MRQRPVSGRRIIVGIFGFTEIQSLKKPIMKKTSSPLHSWPVLGAFAPVAFAQADHSAHHGGASAARNRRQARRGRTVKKIDTSAGKLTIAHGPL